MFLVCCSHRNISSWKIFSGEIREIFGRFPGQANITDTLNIACSFNANCEEIIGNWHRCIWVTAKQSANRDFNRTIDCESIYIYIYAFGASDTCLTKGEQNVNMFFLFSGNRKQTALVWKLHKSNA